MNRLQQTIHMKYQDLFSLNDNNNNNNNNNNNYNNNNNNNKIKLSSAAVVIGVNLSNCRAVYSLGTTLKCLIQHKLAITFLGSPV